MVLSRLSDDLINHHHGWPTSSSADTCGPRLVFSAVIQVFRDGTPESHQVDQNGTLELRSAANALYAADAFSSVIGC